MKRLRAFLAAVRLGYAVASAPDTATALCRLVGVDPTATTGLTVEADASSRLVRYQVAGFSR